MSSSADFVRFLSEPANKAYAKDVIELAGFDYDTSQDLVAHSKRVIRVEKDEDSNSAILLETIVNDAEEEEFVEPSFVIAGILVRACLPPIRSMIQIPEPATSASQEVSIIGADGKQFGDAIIAIEEIHSKFGLEFASGALKTTNQDSFEGERGLTFGTRYFTPSHVCRSETAERLSDAIDPLGILLKAMGGRGKHLRDNMVAYHQHAAEDVSSQWNPIDPSRFRVGQVVQLEVAFRVIPAASKATYRMVPLLRSVALLDSELYTAWEQKVRSTKPISRGRIQFKRSTAYDTHITYPFAARPSKRAKRDARGEDEDVDPEAYGNVAQGGEGDGNVAQGQEGKEGDDNMPFAGPMGEAEEAG